MKRGQGLPINTIILAILGLIVLVILILIFRTQVQKSSEKYQGISTSAEEQARAKGVCETLISGRQCMTGAACPQGYVEIPGPWTDCIKAQKPKCCERTV
jgi:hypothetical protein